MKAQARKILALIMAMVMSLSLAAPAFAEAEEAAESSAPAPEAVEVVETEAPEAEEEEEEEEPEVEAQEAKAEKKSSKKIKAQAADTTVAEKEDKDARIEYSQEDGTYRIYDSKTANTGKVLAAGNLTDKTQTSSKVTVTMINPDDYLIGGKAGVPTYSVTYTDGATTYVFGVASSTTSPYLTVGTAGTVRSLKDADIEWTKLEGDNAKFLHSGTASTSSAKYAKVQGSYYAETKSTGAMNVYFKLNTSAPATNGVNTNIASYNPTAFTNDEVYFVATDVAPLSTASTFEAALNAALECDDLGKAVNSEDSQTNSYRASIRNKPAFIFVDSEQFVQTSYKFTVSTPVDVEGIKAGTINATGDSFAIGSVIADPTDVKIATDKKTGTFQVTIENVTGKTENHYFLSSADEAKELITKALGTCTFVTVDSVTGPQGKTFTVTLSENKQAAAAAKGYSKNIMKYNGSTAVLMNDAVAGWYNGDNDKGANGKTIDAGTSPAAPVVVRWAEVPAVAKQRFVDYLTTNASTYPVGTTTDFATGKVLVYDSTTSHALKTTSFSTSNIDTIVFWNANEMKGKFSVSDCKEGTTIPYSELKLNAVVNGQINPFVTVKKEVYQDDSDGIWQGTTAGADYKSSLSATLDTASKVIVDADKVAYYSTVNWSDPNETEKTTRTQYVATANLGYTVLQQAFVSSYSSFVTKGSIAVSAATHGDLVDIVTETPATCQTPGTRTTNKTCSKCGTIMSTKTEEIPAITDPVEKNTAKDPTDNTKQKMIFDADDLKTTSNNKPATGHYLVKAEPVTTVSDDKMTTTTTVDYYCNFGVKHPEVSQSWSVTKTELQHSGRWNSITLEKATDLEIISNTNGGLFALVKNLIIADSDIDNANIIMNRNTTTNTDHFFKVNLNLGTSTTGWTYENGVYTMVVNDTKVSTGESVNTTNAYDIDVYETSKGVPTTKHYAAIVKISDIKEPQYKHATTTGSAQYCDDGSFVVSATVYEIKDGAKGVTGTAYTDALLDANMAENLQKGKVVVVNDSYKETVTLTGSGHKFFNDDGQATELCTYCGTKKPSETVIANAIDPANVTVKDLTYTGKAAQPKVKVKDNDGFALILGTDYVVSEVDETDVGEYSITIKGINDYAGNKFVKTFKITQAAQPMTVKATAPSAKKLKKKAQKVALTIKKAQGKVSVKVSGPATVKGTTVTAKKGTKKGKKIKITVTAAGNANYKSGSKTVTVKVKA